MNIKERYTLLVLVVTKESGGGQKQKQQRCSECPYSRLYWILKDSKAQTSPVEAKTYATKNLIGYIFYCVSMASGENTPPYIHLEVNPVPSYEFFSNLEHLGQDVYLLPLKIGKERIWTEKRSWLEYVGSPFKSKFWNSHLNDWKNSLFSW